MMLLPALAGVLFMAVIANGGRRLLPGLLENLADKINREKIGVHGLSEKHGGVSTVAPDKFARLGAHVLFLPSCSLAPPSTERRRPPSGGVNGRRTRNPGTAEVLGYPKM
jgi:hypothetical protein